MKVFSYLIIIFFAAFLILLNFHILVFNSAFYKIEFERLGVYEQLGSTDLVNRESSNLISYLCCKKELSGDFFNQREKLHLADVKNLLRITTFQFFLITLLIVVSSLFLLIKKQKKLFILSLQWGSTITFISVIFLSTGIFLRFEKLFINMHLVLFTNDLWQLPPESNLIKLFPQQFFVDFANTVALGTLGLSLLIYLVSYLWGRRLVTKRH